jgi:L-lactate dehydrogenase
MVAARMAEAVLKDEKAVFPASAYNARYGTALSLPSVIGREGVTDVLMPEMTPEETSALERSAETIRSAFEKSMR